MKINGHFWIIFGKYRKITDILLVTDTPLTGTLWIDRQNCDNESESKVESEATNCKQCMTWMSCDA